MVEWLGGDPIGLRLDAATQQGIPSALHTEQQQQRQQRQSGSGLR